MKRISLESYRERYGDRSELNTDSLELCETEAEDCGLPKRIPHTHKYSYGRALIIGGCAGFSGAPVLAANACERSGAGLTHLMVPESIYIIAASRCDGAVVTPLPAGREGAIDRTALQTVMRYLKTADACAVGPGLGRGEGAQNLVREILREAGCPLVLDADALTICGMYPDALASCRVPVVLTPHEGEFKRLGGSLAQGRLKGALDFTAEHRNVILVLKGFGTLVAAGKRITVNPTGSPAMAKGGSGDVLCGLMCGLLAQGFEAEFSARTAVYLHGLAGDLACRERGEYCVTPSDLINYLPAAFRTVTGQS